MSLNNQFCPECSTLLRPKELSDDQEEQSNTYLYLSCDGCFYKERTDSFKTFHFSNKIERIEPIHHLRLVNDYIYDVAYQRTKTKPCNNKNCATYGKENPIIVLITSEHHPEIAYLCTECKHIWGYL